MIITNKKIDKTEFLNDNDKTVNQNPNSPR